MAASAWCSDHGRAACCCPVWHPCSACGYGRHWGQIGCVAHGIHHGPLFGLPI